MPVVSNPTTNGKCLRCGSEARSPPRLQPSSPSTVLHGPAVLNQVPEGTIPSLKGRQLKLNRPRPLPHRTRQQGKGKSKGKDKKSEPSAKSGEPDFDETAQEDAGDQQEPDDLQDDPEEAELYFADSQTSLLAKGALF